MLRPADELPATDRRALVLLWCLVGLGALLVGCGNGGNAAQSTTTTSAAADKSGSCATLREPTGELSALQSVVDATVARRSAAFESEVVFRLDAGNPSAVVRAKRTGAFDDAALEGKGTLTFETSKDRTLQEAFDLPPRPFEFRLVGETWWSLNGYADPPVWFGVDVFEFAETAGGDPTMNMDGDAWVMAVVQSAETVRAVAIDQGSCEIEWSLTIRGDDVAPLLTTGGGLRRLFPEGANTGEKAQAKVYVNSDGMISRMELDLDDWFIAAARQLAPATDASGAEVQLHFKIGDFDQAVSVTVPCANPIEAEQSSPLRGVTCTDN